jgi:excisionase family DNA binding protein
MEEWLKTKEAAEYLQVHPKTLYRYVKAGKLRQYQPGGVGRPRFKREELDALLQGEGEFVNAAESTEATTLSQRIDKEVSEVQLTQRSNALRRRPVRFGGGYPVADAPEERQPHEYESKLQELLQEIEEISQRIEQVRRTVKQLLQTGEQ